MRLRAIAFGKPLHPLLHASMFGLAALMLIQGASPKQRLIRASGILLVAVGLESAQSMIYGHRTEWKDFWSDTFGVLFALLIARGFRQVSKRASR